MFQRRSLQRLHSNRDTHSKVDPQSTRQSELFDGIILDYHDCGDSRFQTLIDAVVPDLVGAAVQCAVVLSPKCSATTHPSVHEKFDLRV